MYVCKYACMYEWLKQTVTLLHHQPNVQLPARPLGTKLPSYSRQHGTGAIPASVYLLYSYYSTEKSAQLLQPYRWTIAHRKSSE